MDNGKLLLFNVVFNLEMANQSTCVKGYIRNIVLHVEMSIANGYVFNARN